MPNMHMELDETLVRERAYALWLQDGALDGRADHYWYQAEREMQAAIAAKPTTKPKSAGKARRRSTASSKRASSSPTAH
jgi:hypothetical protein